MLHDGAKFPWSAMPIQVITGAFKFKPSPTEPDFLYQNRKLMRLFDT
jgi:hypothetical protein